MAEQYEVIRFPWVVERPIRIWYYTGEPISEDWDALRYFPNEEEAKAYAEEEAYEYGEVRIRELE